MTLTIGVLAGVGLLAVMMAACSSGAGNAPPLPPGAARGQAIADRLACSTCHSSNGRDGVGPTWAGSWGSTVTLSDGREVLFDDAYVARAVREPAAERRAGPWPQMPTFGPARLSDQELGDIVAYLRELARTP